MPKILVLDGLSEEGVKVFQSADGFEVDVKPPQQPDELKAVIGDYDGLVVRSATKVPAEVLAKPGNLKVIGRAGVGTDNIDKDEATKQGIVVMNTPGGNTISTCEHTFALLFALCRNVPAAHDSMKAGRWDRKKFMGAEVAGKTIGIVGIGRIGGAVAKRAQSFDMKVIAFDPILTQMKADALGVELVDIDELVERADFITVHAPLNDKTRDLIAADRLKKMKPTCRIVNCARGGIINEEDLAEALRNKTIAGAALDVYTSEPFEKDIFRDLDNVVMTPHLAASTDEAQMSVAVDVAKQMVDYLTTGTIVNAVNVPSLDKEARKALEPFMRLAEDLGKFQSQFSEGRPTKLEVEYCGELGVSDTYPITASMLKGFLEPMVDTVNEVSAPYLLEEHGIKISETRSPEAGSYAFSIALTVHTDNGSHTVEGTLFENNDPRICEIDDKRVDARPEGHMVVSRNEDKPMVLGRIATTIGELGVNIANLSLGRDRQGGIAMAVFNVDEPLDEAALDKIRAIPEVKEVRLVSV